MSGAEAGLVLGLISSTITVITTCRDLYDAAYDTEGLPEAFRKVSENIPLVLDILRAVEKLQEKAKEDFQTSNDAAEKQGIEDTSKAVGPVIQGCKTSAETLETIFKKVLPGEKASLMQRYKSAARTAKPGRKQKVEDLMKDILGKLQLLDSREAYKAAISVSKIEAAINELTDMQSSLPDDDRATYENYGSGPQHVEGGIHGGVYTQADGGTMNFGMR
jgi:hypothetical protein